ncbi:MAG: HEAT repeat domain-containing protein [Deltaproteobacteria bacterium]
MPVLDFVSQLFTHEGKLRRLGKKLTEKYGPPETRQKAIETLAEIGSPAALSALLMRFTISSDPGITDAEEKQRVFELTVDAGDAAIVPLKDFVRRQDSVAWALKALSELQPATEIVGIVVGELTRLGAEYTRDPEKKVQLITWLAEHHPEADPRVGPALLTFLEDMSDDVKLAAVRALAQQKLEAAREPFLQALVAPDQSARVRQDILAALAECGFGVQGYREKVEALLQPPFSIDRSGVLKRQ